MAGVGVALRGLTEQDIACVIVQQRVIAVGHRYQHRHQPQCNRQQQPWHAHPPAPRRRWNGRQMLCPERARNEKRDQHQHGDHADALGDDANAGSKKAQRIPAPGRTEQQMAKKSVTGQGHQKHQDRINLGALRLIGELHREQQHPSGDHGSTPSPQSARQIEGQRDGAERGHQGRQQKRDIPVADHAIGGNLQPHEQRRLVRVQLKPTMRKQIVAGFDHGAGNQRKARFIGRPRMPQSDTGAEHQQRRQHQPDKIAFIPTKRLMVHGGQS